MWLMSKRGFVSVVAYDPKKDVAKSFVDYTDVKTSHVLVRARVKEDLEDLRRIIPNIKITADHSADYLFRAVVKRKDFKRYVADAVDGITYDSHFKEAARDNSKGASGRYSAYMSVWSALMKLQPSKPWTGTPATSFHSKSYKPKKPMPGTALVDTRPSTLITTPREDGDFDSVQEFVHYFEAKVEAEKALLAEAEEAAKAVEAAADAVADALPQLSDEELALLVDEGTSEAPDAVMAVVQLIDLDDYVDLLKAGMPIDGNLVEDLTDDANDFDNLIYDVWASKMLGSASDEVVVPVEIIDATLALHKVLKADAAKSA